MTKPVGVNGHLAETCKICSDRILTAYTVDHSGECSINQFLSEMEIQKYKRLEICDELAKLLKTSHGLPFREFKYATQNGTLHGVYGPNWLSEGIEMYYNMHIDGLDMGEFLRTLSS